MMFMWLMSHRDTLGWSSPFSLISASTGLAIVYFEYYSQVLDMIPFLKEITIQIGKWNLNI